MIMQCNDYYSQSSVNNDLLLLKQWKGAVISLLKICCMLSHYFQPIYSWKCCRKLIFEATISQNTVCELSTPQSLLFQMQSISFVHAQKAKFQASF